MSETSNRLKSLFLFSLLWIFMAGVAHAIPKFGPANIRPMTIHLSGVGVTKVSVDKISISSTGVPALHLSKVGLDGVGIESIHLSTVGIPTVVGSQVSLNELKGLKFNDVYVADPDFQNYMNGAKNYQDLSAKELAQFGVKGEVQSDLEAQMFPKQEATELAAQPAKHAAYTFPTSLSSIDGNIEIEG